MSDSARELAAAAGAMLRGMGYQEGTIRNYRASWNKVIAFCDENGIEEYDEGAERSFFASEGIGPRSREARAVPSDRQGRKASEGMAGAGAAGAEGPRRGIRLVCRRHA